MLAQILQRRTRLPCTAARDGDTIERGRIYVAPPDHHMLVSDEGVVLTRGPRENGHRPAVDPLFRSAARAFGRRVIGVVLSGALDDGAAGLRMIADAGGCALVQDPAEAAYPSMPRSARDYVPSADALPLATIPARICEIIDRPVMTPEPDPPDTPSPHRGGGTIQPEVDPAGTPSGTLTDLTCPECGGTLWQTDENGVSRFRCHVGHSYSPEAFDVSQSEALEGALWGALRSLQERARLLRRLSARADGSSRQRYEARAAEAAMHAEALRSVIESSGREPGEAGGAGRAGE